MTRPIGGKFRYGEITLVVKLDKPGTVCRDCFFKNTCPADKVSMQRRLEIAGYCSKYYRDDGNFVHFESV